MTEQDKKILEDAAKKKRKERIKKWISMIISYIAISFLLFATNMENNSTLEYILNGLYVSAVLCVGAMLINVLSCRLFSAYDEAKFEYEFHRKRISEKEKSDEAER